MARVDAVGSSAEGNPGVVGVTLVCECGSPSIEVVDATYPEDADGRPTGTAFERYECQDCGRTGGFSFGEGSSRTAGCVTTREARL